MANNTVSFSINKTVDTCKAMNSARREIANACYLVLMMFQVMLAK